MNQEVIPKLFSTLLRYAREQSRCKLSGPNYDEAKLTEVVKKIQVFSDGIMVEIDDPDKLDGIIDRIEEYFTDINEEIDYFIKSKRLSSPTKPYERLPKNLYKGLLDGGKKTKRKHYKKSRKSRRNKK